MSENLELILKNVNKFINIDKDRCIYTQHYHKLRIQIFYLLQKEDPFKGLLNGHSLQGSYGDNLKVSMPDEFDSVFVLKLPVFKLAKIEKDKANAGNVRINITDILEKIKNEVQNKAIYELLKKWVDKNNFLVVDKLQAWITSCFRKVLTLLGDEIVVDGKIAKLNYKKQGPAHTIKVTGDNGFFYSVDFVPGLIFSEEQNVLTNTEGTWLAIPKPMKPPQPNSTSFRSSFFEQESQIMRNSKNLKNVLRMMKKFRDCHQNLHNLKSYYIKTIFLMKAKQQAEIKTYWENSISTIVLDMFDELHSTLCTKKLPFFWDVKCNMYEHFTTIQIDEMKNCVANAKKMLSRGQSSMDDAVRFKVYSLFLTSKERQIENIFKTNATKPNLIDNKKKKLQIKNPSNVNSTKPNLNAKTNIGTIKSNKTIIEPSLKTESLTEKPTKKTSNCCIV